MTEISEANRIEQLGLDKGIQQLKLLWELNLIERYKMILKKRIQQLESQKPKLSQKELSIKLSAIKTHVKENKERKIEFLKKLLPSYNLSAQLNIIKENQRFLDQLKKEFNKAKVDHEAYEVTRINYAKKIESAKRNIQKIQRVALFYFQMLKDRAITLEINQDKLSHQFHKDDITKEEYYRMREDIEKEKAQLRKQLKFLKKSVLTI